MIKQILFKNKKITPTPLKSIKSLARKKVWGFSMFETMVGIALMSLFFVYTIQIISQGYGANTKSMKYIGACSTARRILEYYNSWSILDVQDGVSDGIVTNGAYSFSRTLNNITYSCTFTVTDGPGYPVAPLKQLTVAVSWSGGSFSAYSLKTNY